MNSVLRVAYENEIALAKNLIARDELQQGYLHLERAHVIGQAFVGPHVRSHWLMLKVEFRRKRPSAVFGQTVRIVLGALGLAAELVPVGNTGGSDVSMFKRLPISPELQSIVDGGAPSDPLALKKL